MRLPGTRYQEPGWEHVRKLLGQGSLLVFQACDWRRMVDPAQAAALLDWYVESLGPVLRRSGRAGRVEAPGNTYGETVLELALGLLYELPTQPACWQGLAAAIAGEQARSGQFWLGPGADAMLRKKINDMYAGLRDLVDAGNYQVTTGCPCSPNKIYTYRMLDTAYHQLAALFADWRQHAPRVGAILGRQLDGEPIEVRQMKHIGVCKAEWIIGWSATAEQFDGAPGPLHTRSKRFASLKNHPPKIAEMLAEIGDYEQLSANLDSADPWQGDAGEAALWLEDYWRVLQQSESHAADTGANGHQRLPPPADELPDAGPLGELCGQADQADPAPLAQPGVTPAEGRAGEQREVSLPPCFVTLAAAAQDQQSWALRVLQGETLPIRLAVYQKLLGSADDSYPDQWRDPATGELPTLQQLAALDGISMPTLRKRRNQAIVKLQLANHAPGSVADGGASSKYVN